MLEPMDVAAVKPPLSLTKMAKVAAKIALMASIIALNFPLVLVRSALLVPLVAVTSRPRPTFSSLMMLKAL
jgi:hypothetical protein